MKKFQKNDNRSRLFPVVEAAGDLGRPPQPSRRRGNHGPGCFYNVDRLLGEIDILIVRRNIIEGEPLVEEEDDSTPDRDAVARPEAWR